MQCIGLHTHLARYFLPTELCFPFVSRLFWVLFFIFAHKWHHDRQSFQSSGPGRYCIIATYRDGLIQRNYYRFHQLMGLSCSTAVEFTLQCKALYCKIHPVSSQLQTGIVNIFWQWCEISTSRDCRACAVRDISVSAGLFWVCANSMRSSECGFFAMFVIRHNESGDMSKTLWHNINRFHYDHGAYAH